MSAKGRGSGTAGETASSDRLKVSLEPWGPDSEVFRRLTKEVPRQPAVADLLRRARHRLLSLEWLEPDRKTSRPGSQETYRATLYDYTRNRAIVVENRVGGKTPREIEERALQPLPSPDEFAAAVRLVERDPELGPALREGAALPYRPMPPVVGEELPDGRTERIVTVGLLPKGRRFRHEIIGADMLAQKIVRFRGGAPERSAADPSTCGPPPGAGQATVARGTPGAVRVTVRQGRRVLWRFLAVRPARSSGILGSGIDLRFVDYRGKRVLYRAHVPILNVRYDNDACGPFRDWQWQEGMIEANGTDVAPGFRLCPNPAQTILDTGSDVGNFLGVAIYVQGLEVVLVSELEAGWYRYISMWRLHANGRIRPRFGFAAVQNTCTCKAHHHHVYWRLDFDIRTATNNVAREFNDPPLVGSSKWHDKHFEIRRPRNAARKRRWRVANLSTGEAYTLIPGAHDGQADSFGVGDVWMLRYRGTEIDDGQGFTTNPALARANLDKFVNGEAIHGRDVVLWYAAHFRHDLSSGHGENHIVGPDLVPSDW